MKENFTDGMKKMLRDMDKLKSLSGEDVIIGSEPVNDAGEHVSPSTPISKSREEAVHEYDYIQTRKRQPVFTDKDDEKADAIADRYVRDMIGDILGE